MAPLSAEAWLNGQPQHPTWAKNGVIIACDTVEEDSSPRRAYASLSVISA